MKARRLPLHPRPLPHEALSSWICRLAAAYRMGPHRFVEAALGLPLPPIDLGILDNNPEAALIDRLSERTGVPIARVRAMTLAGYGSMLMGGSEEPFTDYVCQFGSLAPTTERRESPVAGLTPDWRPWVCHDLLDNYPRSCRRCLATDQIPHTRIHWRASWMMSCPLHGEMFAPLYQGAESPVSSYEWMPARPASAELLALDRLTLAAVTTGMVDLPSGGRAHAGIWLRTMRTLIDEMTRPAALLRRGGYDRVTQIWREAGRQFHWSIGRLVPFEAMLVDRRELILTITSIAASALFTGKLTAIEENASTVLRPPPRMDFPDLASHRPPRSRWPRGAWWDDRIAEARRDPQVAWSVRALLNMSAGRQQQAEMDSYLEMIGVPIVRNPPDSQAA